MIRITAAGLALGALPLLAGPLAAQARFSLPQGCDAYLTVQMANCTVSHHFTCAGDPEGHQREANLDVEGLYHLGLTDAEAQWIESWFPPSEHTEALEQSPADPASLSAILDGGTDDYDFVTLSDEIGPTRYVGRDSLTGETVTIDGVTLERTEYRITAFDESGTEVWRSAGSEFISRDWRMFLGGESTSVTPEESWTEDSTPVEFISPGEAGFLSANPKHGCGETMSKLEVRP